MKKIISVLIVLSMLMSLALPSFAESNESEDTSFSMVVAKLFGV